MDNETLINELLAEKDPETFFRKVALSDSSIFSGKKAEQLIELGIKYCLQDNYKTLHKVQEEFKQGSTPQ